MILMKTILFKMKKIFSRVIFRHSKIRKNKNVIAGKFSYGNPKVLSWGEGASLTIGNFCSIARGVTIFLGGEHRVDWISTYPFSILFKEYENIKGHPRTKGNVVIGNDVWIGREARILSGVTIGDGAVIGAYSVVTSSVPPYAIVAGNPQKIIRYRFNKDIIDELLEIKWWDWSIEEIKKAIPNILSTDICHFINYANDVKKRAST